MWEAGAQADEDGPQSPGILLVVEVSWLKGLIVKRLGKACKSIGESLRRELLAQPFHHKGKAERTGLLERQREPLALVQSLQALKKGRLR